MSAPLTFELLGGAAINVGDKPLVDLRSKTAEALLIYLACHDRPLPRQFLADFFWDERTQKQASANLRSILSMLRKRIGDYLLADRQTLAFNHELPHWLDSADFERQIRELEPTLRLPDFLDDETDRQLEAALGLYQGEFLAGFHLSESRGFEEWVIVVRERLRRLAVLGLQRLVQHYLTNGRYQEGSAYADRLTAADPYNEEAQRQRMWLLIRSGQQNAALQSFQTFKRLLKDDLGVEPSQATTTVYEKITSLRYPPPDNLPVPPTPFIGREVELNDLLAELVRPDGRLVTIVGPGGAGKTRLATRIAKQLKTFQPGYFLDGIWFVPVAPIHSGRFLVTAVANVLDMTFSGTASPRDQLINYLHGKEILLILDNFEHLLVGDDAGLTLLDDILEHAPDVKLLVTSRERLNLREELIFDLGGLPVPDDLELPVKSAEDYGAMALFLQSARRVSRHYTPGKEDIRAIIQLCKLLEGLPLGLEMAAAWVREDDIGKILSRLKRSLEVLESSWRNIPERHRSLKTVFDHSWQLLTSEEQAGFSRLAVFQGGFTVAAALAVAGVSKPSIFQGKSLLRKEDNGRYEMHNLIQQFTAEMLRTDPISNQEALHNHAHYYLELLHEQENYFASGPPEEALNLIALEIENIRQAWQWAFGQGQIELLNRGYLSLYLYYETRGWVEEGETQFRQTVAALEEQLGTADKLYDRQALIFGRLQSRAAWFAYRCGQLSQAMELAKKSEAIFRRLEAEKDLAQSINDLGILARRSGEYEKGKALLSEALAIRRNLGDKRGVAVTLNNLANAVRMLGDYDQARTYLLESLELLQERGNLILKANAYNDLGEISRATGNYKKARKYYEESLGIRQKIGSRSGIAICLNNLGSVAHTLGDYEGAQQYAQESLKLFIETGNKRASTYPLSVLGRIARDDGDFEASFSSFRRALQICHDINYKPKSLDILFELGTVLEAMDQPAKAVRLLAFIIDHPKINHETRKAAKALFSKLVVLLSTETTEEMKAKGREDNLESVMRAVLSRELEQYD